MVTLKYKCWKLHPEMCPKNRKKDAMKKNLLATYSSNKVERISNVDENTTYTLMYKEVNLSIFHHKEEKEMTKLFHIKI